MELRAWLKAGYSEDEWTDNEYRRMVKAIFSNRDWKIAGCGEVFSDDWETINWKKVHKELWKLLKWATKRWSVYKGEIVQEILIIDAHNDYLACQLQGFTELKEYVASLFD